jgi:hypothetical protein
MKAFIKEKMKVNIKEKKFNSLKITKKLEVLINVKVILINVKVKTKIIKMLNL